MPRSSPLQAVGQRIQRTRAEVSANLDARYREAIISYAGGLHLAGHLVDLEAVAVPPAFFTLPRPFDPTAGDDDADIHPRQLLPLIPEDAAYLGPYFQPDLGLDHLLNSSSNLIIAGGPGSGRTVSLALLAVSAAQGRPAADPRLPLLAHLNDLDFSSAEAAGKGDPMNVLLAAAALRLKFIAGQALMAVGGAFDSGRGLLLLDGWDELPPHRQGQVAAWLQALMKLYPGNRIIVTADVRGCAPLLSVGFAQVFVSPWSPEQYRRLGAAWAAAWPQIGGRPKQPAPPPEQEKVRRGLRGSERRLPIDAVLKLWASLADDASAPGRRGWYQAYLRRVNPAPELGPVLTQAAEEMLFAPDHSLPIDLFSAMIEQARTEQGSSIKTADYLFTLLRETRLLTEYPGGQAAFTQPHIAAFMAAEALSTAPFRESLLDGSPQRWLVLPFLAQTGDVTPYIEALLSRPATFINEHYRLAAACLAEAPSGAAWRPEAFKVFARQFISGTLYPSQAERLMAALVASRDPNVVYIFRQGLRSSDPFIRRLSAVGIGAVGDAEGIIDLGQALEDSDASVEVCAALALGASGQKAAATYLLQTLLTGSEMARRAAAEMFATAMGSEGHDILREALDEQELSTRKAAVQALARIDAPWAREQLEDSLRHDGAFLVRAAAEQTLESMQASQHHGPEMPPAFNETPWVLAWFERRSITLDARADQVEYLRILLTEGSEAERLAGTELLGAGGQAATAEAIYPLLRDVHPEIREAASRALALISLAEGEPLPLP